MTKCTETYARRTRTVQDEEDTAQSLDFVTQIEDEKPFKLKFCYEEMELNQNRKGSIHSIAKPFDS